jgi:hypothetical protein
LDDARERYTKAFEKLTSSAKEHGFDLKTEIAVGYPAEQIVHRTEAGGIDMVFLGQRIYTHILYDVNTSTIV